MDRPYANRPDSKRVPTTNSAGIDQAQLSNVMIFVRARQNRGEVVGEVPRLLVQRIHHSLCHPLIEADMGLCRPLSNLAMYFWTDPDVESS